MKTGLAVLFVRRSGSRKAMDVVRTALGDVYVPDDDLEPVADSEWRDLPVHKQANITHTKPA